MAAITPCGILEINNLSVLKFRSLAEGGGSKAYDEWVEVWDCETPLFNLTTHDQDRITDAIRVYNLGLESGRTEGKADARREIRQALGL